MVDPLCLCSSWNVQFAILSVLLYCSWSQRQSIASRKHAMPLSPSLQLLREPLCVVWSQPSQSAHHWDESPPPHALQPAVSCPHPMTWVALEKFGIGALLSLLTLTLLSQGWTAKYGRVTEVNEFLTFLV